MKFRTDFVTNSSSSSFICEICGNSEAVYDMCVNEVNMVICENDHTICIEHLVNCSEEYKDKMLEYIHEQSDFNCEDSDIDSIVSNMIDANGGYDIPECFCPICQFDEYSQNDLRDYFYKKYKINEQVVFDEIKALNKRRKKLYPEEYNTYVCKEYNLNPAEVVNSWKKEYPSYKSFKNFIKRH